MQPQLQQENGCILSVGGICANDRWNMVIPIACETWSGDDPKKVKLCQLAVEAFVNQLAANMMDFLANDCRTMYVEGHGMKKGYIPYRYDFADPAAGGVEGESAPANCGILATFYSEPEDLLETEKMRTAHMTIPGIPVSALDAGKINTATQLAVDTWIENFLTGYSYESGPTWYRPISASIDPDQKDPAHLIRIAKADAKGYVATQRRRLTPH